MSVYASVYYHRILGKMFVDGRFRYQEIVLRGDDNNVSPISGK